MGLSYLIFRIFENKNIKNVAFAVLIMIIALYVSRSVSHVLDFETTEILYMSGVQAHPKSPNMHFYLGNIYFHSRHEDKSKEAMRRSLAEKHYKDSVKLLSDHLISVFECNWIEGRLGQRVLPFTHFLEVVIKNIRAG